MISFAKLVATTLLVSSTVYAHESPSSHLRGSSEVEWDPYKHYKKVRVDCLSISHTHTSSTVTKIYIL